jgi:tetratricopeptide (TPR) repeat protein
VLTAVKLTELVLLDRSGRSYYLTGDYERALEFIRRDPSQEALYPYIDYLPILGQLGRKEEAREKRQKLLGEDPS